MVMIQKKILESILQLIPLIITFVIHILQLELKINYFCIISISIYTIVLSVILEGIVHLMTGTDTPSGLTLEVQKMKK
jgi:hypothetical protein